MMYDLRTRQTVLFEQDSGWPSWSPNGEFLFFESEADSWIWRVRMRDRKVERVISLKNVRLTGGGRGGWFATAPDNSLITARDAATDEIYALEWEAP